ncbi:3-hydroxyisobutyrate dehydrogenase [Pseudonocardia sediminis]|uniref:3-hydroxyisobutyrate dehydrogenase n=1 Tax=Pseudonocardia sediminis TaxID=1397368 RepID=A0A4V2FQ93_PSEST|nr:NAD(P)-dependent oxidoreductase [Pseudonocardia sediminis]RZT83870.1 3-hydroxyisobutyrate dehydrogenase [Pseudonocardia sediminis]
MTAPTVALLGTGIMGAGMGHNILAAGLSLRVWNRSPEKAQPLVDAGATASQDPAEAVRGADVIVTMLGNADDVRAVMDKAAGGLAKGQVWLQTTTVGVEPLSGLLPIAQEHGLTFLDAPVLGTRQPAETGNLTMFVAGSPDARATVDPVLDAVGQKTVWVADTADGAAASRLKIVANSWVLAVTAATGETISLAQGLGVDPQAFLDAVAGGPLDLPYLQAKSTAILGEDYTPNFTVDNAAKDAGLIVDAGEGADLKLDVAEAVRARLRRASERGHGGDDMAAAYKAS